MTAPCKDLTLANSWGRAPTSYKARNHCRLSSKARHLFSASASGTTVWAIHAYFMKIYSGALFSKFIGYIKWWPIWRSFTLESEVKGDAVKWVYKPHSCCTYGCESTQVKKPISLFPEPNPSPNLELNNWQLLRWQSPPTLVRNCCYNAVSAVLTLEIQSD